MKIQQHTHGGVPVPPIIRFKGESGVDSDTLTFGMRPIRQPLGQTIDAVGGRSIKMRIKVPASRCNSGLSPKFALAAFGRRPFRHTPAVVGASRIDYRLINKAEGVPVFVNGGQRNDG